MKRSLILCAAAAAVLGLMTIAEHKREKEIGARIRWLHARCDGYDRALELLLDGESGVFGLAEHANFPVVDVKETGRRIQQLREARGISVREVQAYLGLDAPQAVYAWQRGESLPSVDHLIGLSKLFGVPVDEVLAVNPNKGKSVLGGEVDNASVSNSVESAKGRCKYDLYENRNGAHGDAFGCIPRVHFNT